MRDGKKEDWQNDEWTEHVESLLCTLSINWEIKEIGQAETTMLYFSEKESKIDLSAPWELAFYVRFNPTLFINLKSITSNILISYNNWTEHLAGLVA